MNKTKANFQRSLLCPYFCPQLYKFVIFFLKNNVPVFIVETPCVLCMNCESVCLHIQILAFLLTCAIFYRYLLNLFYSPAIMLKLPETKNPALFLIILSFFNSLLHKFHSKHKLNSQYTVRNANKTAK